MSFCPSSALENLRLKGDALLAARKEIETLSLELELLSGMVNDTQKLAHDWHQERTYLSTKLLSSNTSLALDAEKLLQQLAVTDKIGDKLQKDSESLNLKVHTHTEEIRKLIQKVHNFLSDDLSTKVQTDTKVDTKSDATLVKKRKLST